MKTSQSNNPKIKNIIISLSLSFSVLLIASCQKDENVKPDANSNSSDLKQSDLPGAPFLFIRIDHYAGNTLLPEYTVTVNAGGEVVFEGKRNVAVQGKVEFEISPSIIDNLNDIFIHSNFMTMKNEAIWSPDLPINSTTYAINRGPVGEKTLHDDNLNPAELVSIRNKAEKLLNISKFLKKQTQVASASGVAIE